MLQKYTLLTGASGLVGRYLLRNLLMDDCRLCVVVRSGKTETARERVESILQMWERELGRPLPRPVIFAGDVTLPRMGLGQDEYRWLQRNCDRVLHNAAVLTFYGSDREGEPWRTNVRGTQHLLELCRETGLRDLHYVSTAYVCGNRPGVIREDELDAGQGFRNDYEASKFESETMVRQADFLDQLTVYRPAVIAGDSKTGYTNTYHGLYMYLKLMSVLVWNTAPGPDGVRYTPVRLNMTGDEPRNIIPVDWVADVICHLLRHREAHGRTFHIAPDYRITPRELIEAGYKYFNSRGVEFAGAARSEERISDIDRSAHENKTIYEPYEVSDPEFDLTNLKRFAGHIPCPRLDEPMLHRFWQYGEQDRWGKRRMPKVEIPFRLEDYLRERLGAAAEAAALGQGSGNGRAAHAPWVGLDVHGPGGGQWNVVLGDDQLLSLQPGLPTDLQIVFQMPADVFADLAHGRTETNGSLASYCRVNRTSANGELTGAVARVLFPRALALSEAAG